MSKRALVPPNVLASPTEPTGQYKGDIYFNQNTQSLFAYNEGSWMEFAPIAGAQNGGTPTSNYTGSSIDGGSVGPVTFDYTYDGGIFE